VAHQRHRRSRREPQRRSAVCKSSKPAWNELAQLITFLYFKRGCAQPGCILGGLRFRSTTIRIFKIVWCFRLQVFHKFFLRNGSN
jgi:hypothetical protein